MVIRELDRKECLTVLARLRLARLGCSRDNQPYIVPVTLICHSPEEGEPCFYGVTIPGQKVEWMRANPMVCVEVDEIEADDLWVSVIVFGRYEELTEADAVRGRAREQLLHFPEKSEVSQESGGAAPEVSGNNSERMRAFNLLSTAPTWWEKGWFTWKARSHDDPAEVYQIVYYKIWIDRVTGHEATPKDKGPAAPGPVPTQSNGGPGHG